MNKNCSNNSENICESATSLDFGEIVLSNCFKLNPNAMPFFSNHFSIQSKSIGMPSSKILNPLAAMFFSGYRHPCGINPQMMKTASVFELDRKFSIKGIQDLLSNEKLISNLNHVNKTHMSKGNTTLDIRIFHKMYMAFILILTCFIMNHVVTTTFSMDSDIFYTTFYPQVNSPADSPNRMDMVVGNIYSTPVLTASASNSSCLTPIHANPSTPNLSTLSALSTDGRSRSRINPNALPFVPMRRLNATNIEIDSDQDSPCSILQKLRLKCIDKIIIGHLNINSIRNKIHLLADLFKDKVDIMLISETKLDSTFPKSQFVLQGFSHPHRLDRTANGGGLLLYLRNDIPNKPLPLIAGNIDSIITDITISKKKWLLAGIYNPNKSRISNHLSVLGKNLDHYLSL